MEGATDDTHGAALPGDQLVLPLLLVERRLGTFRQRELAAAALVYLERDWPDAAGAGGDQAEAADGRALEVAEPGRRKLDGIVRAVDGATGPERREGLRGGPHRQRDEDGERAHASHRDVACHAAGGPAMPSVGRARARPVIRGARPSGSARRARGATPPPPPPAAATRSCARSPPARAGRTQRARRGPRLAPAASPPAARTDNGPSCAPERALRRSSLPRRRGTSGPAPPTSARAMLAGTKWRAMKARTASRVIRLTLVIVPHTGWPRGSPKKRAQARS